MTVAAALGFCRIYSFLELQCAVYNAAILYLQLSCYLFVCILTVINAGKTVNELKDGNGGIGLHYCRSV
jgi:hypothetical protein